MPKSRLTRKKPQKYAKNHDFSRPDLTFLSFLLKNHSPSHFLLRFSPIFHHFFARNPVLFGSKSTLFLSFSSKNSASQKNNEKLQNPHKTQDFHAKNHDFRSKKQKNTPKTIIFAQKNMKASQNPQFQLKRPQNHAKNCNFLSAFQLLAQNRSFRYSCSIFLCFLAQKALFF